MENSSDALLIDNQLCFSIYRLSKFITANYKDYLDEINLTYPQYLVMLVLWEQQSINMSMLGTKLSLDNGTLSPLIKRLIDKELVIKKRSVKDERIVLITLTKKGLKLKSKAKNIPAKMLCSAHVDLEKLKKLKKQVDELYYKWDGQ